MARELAKALVEVETDTITVTFALGEEVPGDVEWETYGVDLYGPGGVGGKRFGVRLASGRASAYIFDWASSTQSNYEGSFVEASESKIVARFRDASLGIPSVGTCRGWSSVNGIDISTDVAVIVLT